MGERTADGPAKGATVKALLGIGAAGAVIVLGVMHRTAVDAGGDSLAGADGEWLLVALLAAAAMWLAGTVSLLGSIPRRPPLGKVFAVQFAASFANHLLPAGSGAMAVNVRFLQRQGISRGAALGAVGLNSLATGITHLALLAATVAIAPSTLELLGTRRAVAVPPAHTVLLMVAMLATLVAMVVLLSTPRRWLTRYAAQVASAVGHMVREMRELGAVLRHPGRAAALWLGSLTLPFFHALILFSILRGLQTPIGAGTVLVIYLGMSSLAALIPSPGAIGGLDVALIAGLVVAGVPSAAAVGTVLGYRMITVWLPLPPAACAFLVLLRRGVI